MQIKISNWKVKLPEHIWSHSRSHSLLNRSGAGASKNSLAPGPCKSKNNLFLMVFSNKFPNNFIPKNKSTFKEIKPTTNGMKNLQASDILAMSLGHSRKHFIYLNLNVNYSVSFKASFL